VFKTTFDAEIPLSESALLPLAPVTRFPLKFEAAEAEGPSLRLALLIGVPFT
jgi:hypothetical protein